MASFLVLAIIGVMNIFGYYLFGGNDVMLYFGIAFVGIGSVCAIIKDLLLAKELKNLREFHIDVSGLMKGFLEPEIYAEFDDPVLAEIYTTRQMNRGYRVHMKSEKDKIIVKVYKEKENEQ